jgi:hypothetical protein
LLFFAIYLVNGLNADLFFIAKNASFIIPYFMQTIAEKQYLKVAGNGLQKAIPKAGFYI